MSDETNRERELELANVKLRETVALLDFARFGFRGTLAIAMAGIALILVLAFLEAFTKFEATAYEMVGLGGLVAAGAVSFGYFSLREAPKLYTRITRSAVEAGADPRGERP